VLNEDIRILTSPTVSGAQPSSFPPGVAGSCGVRYYLSTLLRSQLLLYQETHQTNYRPQPSPSSPNGTLSSRPSATTSDPSTTAPLPSRMACFDLTEMDAASRVVEGRKSLLLIHGVLHMEFWDMGVILGILLKSESERGCESIEVV
jgi:hypothetical protein